MKQTLTTDALCDYVSAQLNAFYPDGERVDFASNRGPVVEALQRLEYCFKHVTLKHYFDGTDVHFNHLFTDHYVMFLWFLSNSVYRAQGKGSLPNKLYCLNKALHGVDCMFDTAMPDIFLIFHGSGTMLGKAKYADFFVVLQGCTVGSHKGEYPQFDKGVSLTANASVIGRCTLGRCSTIATRTTLFEKSLPAHQTAFTDFETGQLKMKQTRQCYAQQFFNVDLSHV